MAYMNGKEILFSADCTMPIIDAEGDIEIDKNGILDVTRYRRAIVNVKSGSGGTSTDSPLPINVATEAEMTSLLATAEVGSVYKYTGESGTYENGALYIVEAVSE